MESDIVKYNCDNFGSSSSGTTRSGSLDLFSGDGGKHKKYMHTFPTYMNVLSMITGAEVLSVSNSMTLTGVVSSVITLASVAIFSYTCTIIILKVRSKTNSENINDIASTIIGRWFGNLYSIINLCFTFSCLTAYIYIGAESAIGWAMLAGLKGWDTGMRRSLLVLIYSLLVPVALTIPRHLKILSLISTGAIFTQFLYLFGMIYEGIVYLPKYGFNPTCETNIGGLNVFNAFAIYSMLFALPSVVLPLVRDYDPHMGKQFFLIGSAFLTSFVIVVIPGVICYLIFGADTKQISISSFDGKDIVMQVVRVGFFIVVNASYAIIGLNVIQDLGSVMFSAENPAKLPSGKRFVLIFLTNLPPVAVGMFLPEIRPVFEVGGAFGGCLANFFVPPLLYVLVSRYRWFHPYNLFMILLSMVGLMVAGLATYQAVQDVLTPG